MTENVTEWCKKEECWKRAKNKNWNILPEFINTLISEEEITSKVKEASKTQKIKNEVDSLKTILALGTSYWKQIHEWGIERGLLTPIESDILQLIIKMDISGKIPSEKQARRALNAREYLIKNGMPMQF